MRNAFFDHKYSAISFKLSATASARSQEVSAYSAVASPLKTKRV